MFKTRKNYCQTFFVLTKNCDRNNSGKYNFQSKTVCAILKTIMHFGAWSKNYGTICIRS